VRRPPQKKRPKGRQTSDLRTTLYQELPAPHRTRATLVRPSIIATALSTPYPAAVRPFLSYGDGVTMALLTNRDATRTDPDSRICIIIPSVATTLILLMTHLHVNSLSHLEVLRVGWGHVGEQWSGRENSRGGGHREHNLCHERSSWVSNKGIHHAIPSEAGFDPDQL
jgi:hypothetical protein